MAEEVWKVPAAVRLKPENDDALEAADIGCYPEFVVPRDQYDAVCMSLEDAERQLLRDVGGPISDHCKRRLGEAPCPK